MATREFAGASVDVDTDGFLVDAEQWSKGIAQAIADEVGVGALGEKHWQVIEFCRTDAKEQGQSPGLRRISKMSGVAMKELYQLFPKGPGKLAAMVAGLPKPKACI